MNKSSIPLAPQLVREVAEKLGADYAAKSRLGTAAQKISTLLKAIAAKCATCSANSNGHTDLNEVADCPDSECPLNDFGPSVYQCVRAKLESQGGIAGGLQ